MSNSIRRVVIVGGNRTPFARSNSVYKTASNQQLLTAALTGLVERFNLRGQTLGEVVAGAVIKHSRDFNLTRESVLDCGLNPQTPCYDIQQACGTGLEAAILVANKIALGQIDCGIAGGSDTTSDAPIGVSEGLRKILLECNRGQSTGDKLKPFLNFKPRDFSIMTPSNAEPRTGLSMGQHCQVTAAQWQIPRLAQDELTLRSHKNLARAYDDGFFQDLITPFAGVERDTILRPDSSLEKLSSLSPVFDRDNGTMTAANSTNLTDGASAVLLASEAWAEQRGLPVLAYFSHSQTSAVDFSAGKEGLLMAPTYAVPKLLDRAGLSLQDFDYYEIHEAFAAQVLSTLAAWEDTAFCRDFLGLDEALGSIDRAKLNVNGSSLATGHPFAATGGRIVATLAKLLAQKGRGRGLISICAAGGLGITAIIER